MNDGNVTLMTELKNLIAVLDIEHCFAIGAFASNT